MHQRKAPGAGASVSGRCSPTTAEAASWASVLHPGITADTHKLESELKSFGSLTLHQTLRLWLALTSHDREPKSCSQHEQLESKRLQIPPELFRFTIPFPNMKCVSVSVSPPRLHLYFNMIFTALLTLKSCLVARSHLPKLRLLQLILKLFIYLFSRLQPSF